jgi:hypothetical protein
MNEVTKKEAEAVLGGPLKQKPKMPPGKQPAGYRYVRGLARKAMKAGMKKDEYDSPARKAMERELQYNPKYRMEEVEQIDEVNEKQIKKDLDSGMSHDAVIGKHANKKLTNTDAIRKVINQHAWNKRMKKEEVEQVVEQNDAMEKKEMAQTQLHFIGYAAKEILEFIDMGGEIEEWYQNKLSKVQSEVESLHSYIEGEKRRTGMVKEEEQIDEKAPPGAKYERMVKHIKKGYAKGGLTDKERSIAYATAWKAHNKANEEVEQTDEAIRVTMANRQLPPKSKRRVAGGAPTKSDMRRDVAAAAAKEKRSMYGHKGLPMGGINALNVLMPKNVKKGQETWFVGAKKTNEEVEQIDELKKSTLASYVNKAAHQVRAKSGIAASFETQGTRKRNPENKSAYMDVAKDFRQGAKKRLTGIEKATAKLSKEEVEQVEEKYENNPLHSMPRPNKAVGLKPSQLAKKPVTAEVAEGSVPTTPKEKELAKHHGDPNRITFGDVIKARLKSVAAKKMGK